MSNVRSVMGLAYSIPDPYSGPPMFVGSASNSGIDGASVTVDLSSIDIQSGDLILAGFFVGEDADRRASMSLTSTGYTEITSLYGNDTYDINMKTYGKFSDGTETDFITSGNVNVAASVVVIVSVFRGAGDTLPTNSSTGLAASGAVVNSSWIVWPQITNTESEDILVYFGSTGHVSGTLTYNDPADLLDFTTLGANDSEDVTAGYGYKVIDAESSFTANQWTLGASASASAIAYTVFKLRQA